MIKDNYEYIKNNVINAAKNSGFNKTVTLIAVSKTHPASMIQEVYDLGQRDFGENKVQEITEKYDILPKDIRWHMIGHLQTNKVKYIIDKVCLIHSVDSLKLAETIDKEAQKHDLIMPVLIEVNIGEESSKSGIPAKDLIPLVEKISLLPNIKIKGLMCIPPIVEDPESSRIYFKRLRNLSIDIKGLNNDNIQMDWLSMGMSDDYLVAIEEGSDMVRVGTSIFGSRNYNI